MKLINFLLVAVCFTQLDIMNAKCHTACLWAGYDEGFFRKEMCWCVDLKDTDKLTGQKRITLGSKRSKPSNSDY